jgi:hypothetical protein
MKATCAFPLKYHKWSVMQVWDVLLVCRAWLGDKPKTICVFLVFKLIFYFPRKYLRKVAPFFINGQSLVNVSDIIGNPLGNSIPRVRQCQQPSRQICYFVGGYWQLLQRAHLAGFQYPLILCQMVFKAPGKEYWITSTNICKRVVPPFLQYLWRSSVKIISRSHPKF